MTCTHKQCIHVLLNLFVLNSKHGNRSWSKTLILRLKIDLPVCSFPVLKSDFFPVKFLMQIHRIFNFITFPPISSSKSLKSWRNSGLKSMFYGAIKCLKKPAFQMRCSGLCFIFGKINQIWWHLKFFKKLPKRLPDVTISIIWIKEIPCGSQLLMPFYLVKPFLLLFDLSLTVLHFQCITCHKFSKYFIDSSAKCPSQEEWCTSQAKRNKNWRHCIPADVKEIKWKLTFNNAILMETSRK